MGSALENFHPSGLPPVPGSWPEVSVGCSVPCCHISFLPGAAILEHSTGTCGRKPQLEALLQTCGSVVLCQGLLEGLLSPPPLSCLPAGSGTAPGVEAAGWRLPGRAQAAVTWERKHLTFEAATQYRLLCGGSRGRRLAINSLLRANSSSVLWNQTVLPPRGGAAPLSSFPSALLLGCS